MVLAGFQGRSASAIDWLRVLAAFQCVQSQLAMGNSYSWIKAAYIFSAHFYHVLRGPFMRDDSPPHRTMSNIQDLNLHCNRGVPLDKRDYCGECVRQH